VSFPDPGYLSDGSFVSFHRAEAGSRDVVAVVCPTIGYEAISSHRALRVLAERLASRGTAALRVDYHGTGDSAGSDDDDGRVEAWLRSIHLAADAAKTLSGARRVVLFGLRLGANLAAVAASRRDDVAGLVLYAPCTSGKSFVRETRAFRLLAAASEGLPPPEESGDLDAAGFVLRKETLASLAGALAWPASVGGAKVLVLARDDAATDERVLAALRATGAEVLHAAPPGYAAMMVDPHRTVVPVAAFDEAVSFVGSLSGEPASALSPSRPAALSPALSAPAFEERPRWIGRGIFSISTVPSGRRRGTAVLLNPGSVHHVGSNRLHVRWARAWAERGIATLRIDVGGIGESPPAPGARENETYSKSAVPDVLSAVREASLGGPVAIVGLCSGAYAAYHAALAARARDEVPRAVVLINPQTFHYRDGDSLDVSPLGETKRYRASALDPEKWRRLLSGKVDLANVAKIVLSRAALEVRTRLARHLGGPDVRREIATLLDRDVDVLLVYSATDPGLDYLTMETGRSLDRLRRRPNLRLELVQQADHTFTPLASQDRLTTILTAHLDRVFR
jgi:alpha/beta superfamily hydrolase